MRTPCIGGPSPWGPIQSMDEKAEGIVEVSTAGHGGVWLSYDRRAEMPEPLRTCPTFAASPNNPHGCWYEEDEDVVLVVLAFPKLWPAQVVWNIMQAPRFLRPEVNAAVSKWRHSPAVHYAEDIAKTWEDEHTGWWYPGGGSSDGDGWRFWYTQVGTGDQALRHTKDYPTSPIVKELPGEPIKVNRAAGRGA